LSQTELFVLKTQIYKMGSVRIMFYM